MKISLDKNNLLDEYRQFVLNDYKTAISSPRRINACYTNSSSGLLQNLSNFMFYFDGEKIYLYDCVQNGEPTMPMKLGCDNVWLVPYHYQNNGQPDHRFWTPVPHRKAWEVSIDDFYWSLFLWWRERPKTNATSLF